MIAKAASYSLFGAAITKVRRRNARESEPLWISDRRARHRMRGRRARVRARARASRRVNEYENYFASIRARGGTAAPSCGRETGASARCDGDGRGVAKHPEKKRGMTDCVRALDESQSGTEDEFTCEGPITVFAPNDDAFADFCKAQGLSKVEIMTYAGLKDVVLNHVAKGAFTAANMPAEVTMVSGKKVATSGFSYKKNDIKVDNATIHAITAVVA